MRKLFSKYILPSLIVVACGIILTAIAWLAYVGIYLSLEAIFYPTKPQDFPADTLRIVFASLFMGAFLLIYYLTKWPELIKAIILNGTLTIFLITIVLSFYTQILVFISIILVIVGLVIGYLIWRKKSWLYYVATGFSLLISLLYAWPR